MRHAEILTIGSLVVDSINGTKTIGGAAANVAVNVSELGAQTSMLTALSRDEDSDTFQTILERRGITVNSLLQLLEVLPYCNIHMGDDGKEISYEWNGNGIEELFQRSEADTNIIRSASQVYLAICERVFASRVTAAVSADQTLSFNPGSRVFEGLEHFREVQERADHIFLNEREYGHLVAEGYIQQPRDLIVRPNQVVVITAGNRDTTLVTAESVQSYPVETLSAIDETGAGDSFASAFLWGRSQGYPVETCVKLGNLLASFVVQRVGAQIDRNTASQFNAEARRRNLIQ